MFPRMDRTWACGIGSTKRGCLDEDSKQRIKPGEDSKKGQARPGCELWQGRVGEENNRTRAGAATVPLWRRRLVCLVYVCR